MTDVQDMMDEEWWLHLARESAARKYRAEGYVDFANCIERGEEDSCSLVRIARFFFEPPQPHGEEFTSRWDEFAARHDSKARREDTAVP